MNILQFSAVVSKNVHILLISKADIIVDFVHFAKGLHLSFHLEISHTYNFSWEQNWNSFQGKATLQKKCTFAIQIFVLFRFFLNIIIFHY